MAVFFVNGTEVNVPKNQKLLRYLRDELHLTSVKDGCSEGACGACTVLIDGEPCRACTPSTDALEGRHILTVEGLTDEEKKLYTLSLIHICCARIRSRWPSCMAVTCFPPKVCGNAEISYFV